MRRTLGTAVFSGMLGVTLFGIFLTPVFFCVIDWPGPARAVPLARRANHRRRAAVHAHLRLLWIAIRFLAELVRSPSRRPIP